MSLAPSFSHSHSLLSLLFKCWEPDEKIIHIPMFTVEKMNIIFIQLKNIDQPFLTHMQTSIERIHFAFKQCLKFPSFFLTVSSMLSSGKRCENDSKIPPCHLGSAWGTSIVFTSLHRWCNATLAAWGLHIPQHPPSTPWAAGCTAMRATCARNLLPDLGDRSEDYV